MRSPAWNHRNRVLRREEAAKAVELLQAREAGMVAKLAGDREKFDLLLVELENNLKRIKAHPSGGSERIALKKQFIAGYAPLIEAYLKAAGPYENRILVYSMIWSFDIGDIAEGCRLARICVSENQPMPFKSSARIFWADAVFDWAGAEFAADRAVAPYFDEQYDLVTGAESVALYHEEIQIKYRKLKAAMLEKSGDFAAALAEYRAARSVNPDKATVKTAIARLEKLI